MRATMARGWGFRASVPRRPPAPDLHTSSGGKGIRTPDLLTARLIWTRLTLVVTARSTASCRDYAE